MTIQISLVIWTIIGFVVLSLILNHFLFKPLLHGFFLSVSTDGLLPAEHFLHKTVQLAQLAAA